MKAPKWSGRAIGGAVAAAIVGALGWAWLPERPLVETARVGRGDVVVEVLEDGVVRVRERYVVAAPLDGTLLRVILEPGDAVRGGAVVAEIVAGRAPLLDPRAQSEARARLATATEQAARARTQVSSADVQAALASRDVERAAALVEVGALPARDLEQARADATLRRDEARAARLGVAVAEAEVEAARATLEPTELPGPPVPVLAPRDGVVLEVLRESAGPVRAGEELLAVGDVDALEIVADLASEDAVRLSVGAPARVERWGGEPLPAYVAEVEPSAETRISALGVEEQRVDVILAFDAPPDAWARLGDGYGVEARIALAHREGVVVVPEAAVFLVDGETSVFRVVGRRVRRVTVSLGLRDGVRAEVLDGLAEGDVVVVHPTDDVVDGVRVRAVAPEEVAGGARS